jgi:hypothetical protein
MAAITGANASDISARTVMAWFPPPSALRREADGSVTIRHDRPLLIITGVPRRGRDDDSCPAESVRPSATEAPAGAKAVVGALLPYFS